jgi:hypothetical protein
MSRTNSNTQVDESTDQVEVVETPTHEVSNRLAREGFIKPMELAKALGIKPQQVYQYTRKGKLETVIEPHTGKILIKVESAAAWLTARDQRTAAAAEKAAAELESDESVEA